MASREEVEWWPVVFYPALGADDRVVAAVVRSEEAIHVAGLDAIFQLHENHVVILDVHVWAVAAVTGSGIPWCP